MLCRVTNPSVPVDVTLVDAKGASWRAMCLQPPNGPAFLTGSGWKAYAEAWTLQMGDHITMEACALPGSFNVGVVRCAHECMLPLTLASLLTC